LSRHGFGKGIIFWYTVGDDFYHGTNIANLKELKPFAYEESNLKESCVYLTTSRQVALFYIWDFDKDPIRRMMMDIRDNGVVFQEMFSGALERFYKGTRGYIYHCIGDYEMSEESGVKTCAISREPVPVSDVEYIEDVYEEIMKYEKQGKFIYEKYEELPQWRLDIIRGHAIRAIKNDNLLNSPDHPHYYLFQEKFPKYWREAEVLDKHGLL
jgi:hypothetical protein